MDAQTITVFQRFLSKDGLFQRQHKHIVEPTPAYFATMHISSPMKRGERGLLGETVNEWSGERKANLRELIEHLTQPILNLLVDA